MKTYRDPRTSRIRQVDDSDSIKIAALEKLGWKEITGEDIANDPTLTVVYEKVTPATQPVEPPALPRLATPVPSAPTSETSTVARTEELKTPEKVGDAVLVVTEQSTGATEQPAGITSEDVQPLSKGEKSARG